MCLVVVFFFKQKTAYEMRISDWSSDVCSSDLAKRRRRTCAGPAPFLFRARRREDGEIAVGAADEPAVLIQARIDIGDALAPVQYLCLAGQAAFADAAMIIELDLERRTPLAVRQQAVQCPDRKSTRLNSSP